MYNSKKHKRKSIRRKNYDYTKPGAYFVTICTYRCRQLFGKINNQKMILNITGMAARKYWLEIPDHFPQVKLDAFVIMPDHIHGLFWIVDRGSRGEKFFAPDAIAHTAKKRSRPRGTSMTVGSIVRGFKIGVTKWVRKRNPGQIVWQRNYHDRIIQNDTQLFRIRQYIENNPANWKD